MSQFDACRGASRHDDQMINARIIPADPYAVWLEQREAERRGSSGPFPVPSTGRFTRQAPGGAETPQLDTVSG